VTLQDLIDRAAIHDVLLRYARGVDRRDLTVVAACFTPDAAYQGASAPARSRRPSPVWARRWHVTRSTLHVIATDDRLEGDAAHSETYCLAHQSSPTGVTGRWPSATSTTSSATATPGASPACRGARMGA